MVKISVVLMVHAYEELVKSIDFLQRQTLKDFEIIGINDGLTDDNIKDIKGKININIINHPSDLVKNLNGEYLTFIDSNDYIEENMLDSFYQFAKKHTLDITTSSYYEIKSHKEILINHKYKIGNVKTSPQILCLFDYRITNKLFKKDFFVKELSPFHEDLSSICPYLLCKLLKDAKLIGNLDKAYYHYTNVEPLNNNLFCNLQNILNDYQKEYYLQYEINYVMIKHIMAFLLQQKDVRDKEKRRKNIKNSYLFLDNHIKKWKKNKYYHKLPFSKKMIINHEKLLKIYISTSIFLRRNNLEYRRTNYQINYGKL